MTSIPIALVTGANRGLGRATAVALAARGYRVVAASRGGAVASADVVAEIERGGGEAIGLRLDVADVASFADVRERLLAEIARRWDASRIAVLVNNAGIGVFGPLEAVRPADFDATFAVNVRGPFFLIQAFADDLVDGGRVINVSSSLSRHVSPTTSVYAASKIAVEALTRSLAVELGPRGIRVNTIAPGPTATDFNGGAMRDDAGMRAALAAQTALGRVGRPEEVAAAIVALASDDLRWVTGERIEVSGGALL